MKRVKVQIKSFNEIVAFDEFAHTASWISYNKVSIAKDFIRKIENDYFEVKGINNFRKESHNMLYLIVDMWGVYHNIPIFMVKDESLPKLVKLLYLDEKELK